MVVYGCCGRGDRIGSGSFARSCFGSGSVITALDTLGRVIMAVVTVFCLSIGLWLGVRGSRPRAPFRGFWGPGMLLVA